MFRFKLLVIILMLAPLTCFAAQKKIGQKFGQKFERRVEKPKPPKIYSDWEVGGSYLIWNEPIRTSRGGVESQGFANYGGFGVGVEKHWRRKRMLYSTMLTVAAGKVSSGGFSPATNFTDGINRAWKAAHLTFSGNYGLSPTFYIGTGLLIRYREVDWIPMDTTLTVSPWDRGSLTGQLILRWEIARTVQMTQVFAPLDLNGATLWQWILMIRL